MAEAAEAVEVVGAAEVEAEVEAVEAVVVGVGRAGPLPAPAEPLQTARQPANLAARAGA